MSDLGHYRDQVAELGKKAKASEDEKNYEDAFHYYTKALELFNHMVKCKAILHIRT